jgi:SAM-dependent methyltransferase
VPEQAQFQLSGNAAELYEQYSDRYFMAPWARELVELAALRRGERVLDLACGTGVVTRIAAQKVGPTGKITGLDLNAGMLAVARSLPQPPGVTIDWLEASATATNLPDTSFDIILCQQGFQFFPDKPAALREMRRVLVPGGRVFLSVWKAPGPYNFAVGDALERHVGTETAARYRASRSGLPDQEALHRLLVEAGFGAVQIRASVMKVRLPSIEAFVLGHLSGLPVAAAVASLSDTKRAALAAQVKAQLQPYADGDGVSVPDEVNIAIARA